MNQSAYSARAAGVAWDTGLARFLTTIYNRLFLGLLVTGLAAWLVSTVPAVQSLFFNVSNGKATTTLLGLLVQFAPLAIIIAGGFVRTPGMARAVFWGVAALFGVSISAILLVYTGVSVFQTFFVTAIGFGGLSLYGMTTKRDLQPIGKFLTIALFGLLAVVLLNLFLNVSWLSTAVSAVGLLIFAGLTVYDTQRLKNQYAEIHDSDSQTVAIYWGALSLYLDLLNLFMFLLHFLGVSKNE